MEPTTLYAIALWIVLDVSFVRCGGIVFGAIRGVRNYRRAEASQIGLIELINWPEPIVLVLVTLYLMRHFPAAPPFGVLSVTAAVLSAAIALAAISLTLWALISLPTVSGGHYVLKDQPIVERGAFAWVRHPIYLGVFLIWFTLALAFQSLATLLIAALYVVPSYVLYIRAEEKMMRESYGAAYDDYCKRVGGLFPRFRLLAHSPLKST